MIVIPKIELENEDAAYLVSMAAASGMTLAQLCASILTLVVADDRTAEEGEAA